MSRIWNFVFILGLCGGLLGQHTQTLASAGAPQGQQTSPSQTAPSTSPQPADPTAPTANSQHKIAPGSVIPVQLTKSIDAKKAKKGDAVVAKVTQDMANNSGTVLVPKDTQIVGHISDAQPRSKEQKESQLVIAFDQVQVKGGEQMKMPMSIQAIIAPPNRDNSQTAEDSPSANAPGSPGGSAPTVGGARAGTTGGSPPTQNTPNPGVPSDAAGAAAQARPQITGNTQGVVGIPDLQLSQSSSGMQGSLITSEKKNVKLDDGTLLLLKVNQ